MSLEVVNRSALRRAIGLPSKYPDIRQELVKSTLRSTLIEARRRAPIDTGKGMGDMRLHVTKRTASIQAPLHMIVQDQGRAPGKRMPPVSAIEPWLRRKQAAGQLRGANAFVIARAIGRKGIPAKNFFSKSYDHVVQSPRWRQMMQRQWAEAIDRELSRG